MVFIRPAAEESARIAVNAADMQPERLLGIFRADRVEKIAAELAHRAVDER